MTINLWWHYHTHVHMPFQWTLLPSAGSGVVRIDPLHVLAGCLLVVFSTCQLVAWKDFSEEA